MRVLQVEDDAATAAAIEFMLASKDYACDTVGLGEDAVERARSTDYDIILVDIMLPDIDGFEVLRRLHAAHVRIPSIIQSSLIGHDQKLEGLSLGVDDFLVKPFSKRELMGRIKLALECKRDAVEDLAQHHGASDRRAAPQRDSAECRRIKRARTLKSGQIIYKNSNYVIDCLIMDLSETGARLEVVDIFDCPSTILLQIFDGPTYRCKVRWQSGKTLGVVFLTELAGQPAIRHDGSAHPHRARLGGEGGHCGGPPCQAGGD